LLFPVYFVTCLQTRNLLYPQITETVLGSLSVLLGILLLVFGLSIAEGLWCGLFVSSFFVQKC